MTLYGSFRTFLRLFKYYGFFQAISIQKQARSQKYYIEFKYQKQKLRIKNEKAAIHHILYSLGKMEKLARSIVENGSNTFLDIGANCGIFAYFFKLRFPEVMLYCFEPSYTLNGIIKFNLRSFEKWEIINQVISDQTDQIEFYENRNSMQSSSIFREMVTPYGPPDQIIKQTIQSTTIDVFCLNNGIPDLLGIKLDIQGAESLALKYGQYILRYTGNLILEFWLETDIFGLMNQIPVKFRENHRCINDGIFYGDLLFLNNW